MNEWLNDGRKIADKSRTSPEEKAELLAHISAIELSRQAGESITRAKTPIQPGEAPLVVPDLRAETFNLLGSLREPTVEEQAAIKEKGGIILEVEAKSLQQVYDENPGYFDYVNSSKSLREYTPPQAFKVAVFPQKLRIPKSNNSTRAEQLEQTGEYSKSKIEPDFPGARAIMLPLTGIAQLDIGFQKENHGKKLLVDFWVGALDEVGSHVADIGRGRPGDRLDAGTWYSDYRYPYVWALSTVVFTRE